MRSTIMSAVAGLALASPAVAADIIDQQQTTSTNYYGTTDAPAGTGMGQSFRPTLDSIGFIRLNLFAQGINTNVDVRIDIFDGAGFNGTLLGFSDTLTVNTTSGVRRFDFTAPVALTAGSQYTFRVTGSDDLFVLGSSANPYADGVRYFSTTQSNPTSDLYFVEGITVPDQPTVPEPATWALMVVGFGVAGMAVRRHRPALA